MSEIDSFSPENQLFESWRNPVVIGSPDAPRGTRIYKDPLDVTDARPRLVKILEKEWEARRAFYRRRRRAIRPMEEVERLSNILGLLGVNVSSSYESPDFQGQPHPKIDHHVREYGLIFRQPTGGDIFYVAAGELDVPKGGLVVQPALLYKPNDAPRFTIGTMKGIVETIAEVGSQWRNDQRRIAFLTPYLPHVHPLLRRVAKQK